MNWLQINPAIEVESDVPLQIRCSAGQLLRRLLRGSASIHQSMTCQSMRSDIASCRPRIGSRRAGQRKRTSSHYAAAKLTYAVMGPNTTRKQVQNWFGCVVTV